MSVLSNIWNIDDSFHHVPSTVLRNAVIRVYKMVYVHHTIVETVTPDQKCTIQSRELGMFSKLYIWMLTYLKYSVHVIDQTYLKRIFYVYLFSK